MNLNYLMVKMQVQNCYKMKNDASSLTPTVKAGDTVEEAAEAAAYKIAEAENKSFVAAEAVKEAERISEIAEDADSLLQLAKEIFEKCNIQSPDFSLLLP
jgi:myb proto-oncogene protein